MFFRYVFYHKTVKKQSKIAGIPYDGIDFIRIGTFASLKQALFKQRLHTQFGIKIAFPVKIHYNAVREGTK